MISYKATIFKNKIDSINFIYQNRRPLIINKNTIMKHKFYIGSDLLISPNKNHLFFTAAYNHDKLQYNIGYDILHTKNPTILIGIKYNIYQR
jgi:hypothetical protein